MKCPHCLVNFHAKTDHFYVGQDVDGIWSVLRQECSACDRAVLILVRSKSVSLIGYPTEIEKQQLINPRGSTRPPCPSEVSKEIAEDYMEACVVLPDSSKASAALSRRCLQALLRDKGGVKPGDLSNEIQQVIDSNSLPSHLADSIDAIRNIGNFSAHPLKSKNTGEILPVEDHEAEWNLDVLESLFDFYYVQPAKLQAKRNALNQKLAEVGKPPMK
jgi:Domain of unknown function (DUF4145)